MKNNCSHKIMSMLLDLDGRPYLRCECGAIRFLSEQDLKNLEDEQEAQVDIDRKPIPESAIPSSWKPYIDKKPD